MVHDFFLFLSHKCVKRTIRLLRCLRIDDPDPIHYTMNMCIDADIRRIIEDREDDLRGLDTDSWKCLQKYEIIRNNSIILHRKYRTRFFDKSGFVMIKIHKMCIRLNLFK